MMFRSLSSALSKFGPVTATGSSVSSLNTAKEHVASNPMPRMLLGSTFCSESARCTEEQMHFQMLVVDCSYAID